MERLAACLFFGAIILALIQLFIWSPLLGIAVLLMLIVFGLVSRQL
jgi:hypothetical protein